VIFTHHASRITFIQQLAEIKKAAWSIDEGMIDLPGGFVKGRGKVLGRGLFMEFQNLNQPERLACCVLRNVNGTRKTQHGLFFWKFLTER
jgi:hypothetical protein